jgi:hypothetical protein
MNLSRSVNPTPAILVPKVKEPWLKRPLDVTLSSLMLILCQGTVAAVSDPFST